MTFPHTVRIVIDCDPYHGGRQENYFKTIWTKILNRPEEEMPERVSAFFGEWTWDGIRYENAQQKEAVGSFLTKLYKMGSVRYAEW